MVIHGLGTLILGESGTGKSDLCLDLLKLGHSLVADDAIHLTHQQQSLFGSAPKELQNKLAIRGLGLLTISEIFGPKAYMERHRIELAVRLIQPQGHEWPEHHALKIDICHITLLHQDIPCYTLPVGPNRNLASLIETLVYRYGHCKAPLE